MFCGGRQEVVLNDRPTDSQTTRWRHLKRGTTYEEIGRARLQASYPPNEGDVLVIYRGDDGKLWAREENEFLDGRFERQTDAE